MKKINLTEREKLKDDLVEIVEAMIDWNYKTGVYDIADFILEDRKRIVEPLVKYLEADTYLIIKARQSGISTLHHAIDKTLKLSGVKL